MKNNKVRPEQLKGVCEPENFDFETTADIEPFSDGIIGQNRAVKAIDLGLKVNQQGYNIYMSGDTGTGKSTYAKSVAREKAAELEIPEDICYVYNFKDSERPKSLIISPGDGSKLNQRMKEIIQELRNEIPQAFAGEEYEEKKREIMNEYQQESNEMMEEFEKDIRDRGFILQNTPQGPQPVPVDKTGDTIDQDRFQQMDDDNRKELREKSQKIQSEMQNVMRKIRQIKEEAQEELKNEEKKIALSVIQPIFDNLKREFADSDQIKEYLEQVQEDIIENVDQFKQKNEKKQSIPIPVMQRDNEDFFKRYQINLLVDNGENDNAPVVYESNPSYYNLFGKIEGEGKLGTVTTDFTMIKEGAVHRANGGYLILKVKDVLSNPFSWETLKRTLLNQEVIIENIGEQYRAMPIRSLKPEEIPIDLKVILIGNPLIYQLLCNYDEEFEKLFKIKAEFDVEMKKDQKHIREFASFISLISKKEDIRDFHVEAVCEVIEFSSRLTGDKEKMTTRFNEILELLYEADIWAEENDRDIVQKGDVLKAVTEKEKRANLAEEKIQEMIARDHILVDVKAEEIGQINGLAVYQTGQYTFGKPSRITARTYLGQEGVINIEREVDMSGKIHNKGVMILSGYLGGKYAQERPLSLSASLAFEQSYGEVDGDSASCAELIALLSAIGEIPVKQSLALTGSLNQKGKVQPIGGVNEKIEGYYKTCKEKGLTGKQGVIIPEQNKDNLMLKEEIIEAVDKGKFNIYAVENIDEIIELMMDKPAAEIHKKIKKSLEEFAKKAEEYKESQKDKKGK